MAAPATYISRVQLPLIRPIPAPQFAAAGGVNATVAQTQSAKERIKYTYTDGNKLHSSNAKMYFSNTPIQIILDAKITSTGDHSEDAYKQQASLKFAEQTWESILSKHQLEQLLGTNAIPNFDFPVRPDGIAVTLEQRIKMNHELYAFLKQFTSGTANDTVVNTPGRDGIAALRNLRINFHARIVNDQQAIDNYLNSKDYKVKEKSPPENFLRKNDVILSIHDSYGENEKTDRKKRDLLRETMRNSLVYKPLYDWCAQNLDLYNALSYIELKAKMVNTYELRPGKSSDNDSRDMPEKRKRAESNAAKAAKGDKPKGKGLLVSDVTSIKDLSKKQRKTFVALLQETPKVNKYKGGGKG